MRQGQHGCHYIFTALWKKEKMKEVGEGAARNERERKRRGKDTRTMIQLLRERTYLCGLIRSVDELGDSIRNAKEDLRPHDLILRRNS